MTTRPLIEALVKLVDDYGRLDNAKPVSAFDLIEDVNAKYEGRVHWPLDQSYQALLSQADAMIKRHFGVTYCDYELLKRLHREMDDLEENAND